MPRSPRIVVPGYPHHVVHRGHNRRAIFLEAGDCSTYLDWLRELMALYAVRLHAYCLMPNHVHMLLVPETVQGLGQVMKRLAGRYTARLNRREARTGTLWEGRYYSSVVARDSYFTECSRYIELNPVRASLVPDPALYAWSSCHLRASGSAPSWLDPEPWFLDMGATSEERWQAYRGFLAEGVAEDRRKLIREAVYRGQPTGGPEFASYIATVLGRPVANRGPGRPRQNSSVPIFGAVAQK